MKSRHKNDSQTLLLDAMKRVLVFAAYDPTQTFHILPLSGGCSEGLDAFSLSLNDSTTSSAVLCLFIVTSSLYTSRATSTLNARDNNWADIFSQMSVPFGHTMVCGYEHQFLLSRVLPVLENLNYKL